MPARWHSLIRELLRLALAPGGLLRAQTSVGVFCLPEISDLAGDRLPPVQTIISN